VSGFFTNAALMSQIVMRIEDNKLARKLLDVRSELTVVRAQQSCLEHAEMLDDVAYELEEEEEVTGLIKGEFWRRT